MHNSDDYEMLFLIPVRYDYGENAGSTNDLQRLNNEPITPE